MKVRQWYRVENRADDPSVAEIWINDFIGDWIDDYFGFGVTAKSFIAELGRLSAAVQTIRVHINSPGGDVFSAVTIANALRDQQATKGRVVDTIVDGIAASAASIVMMAGRTVQIADNGIVMIHNPWSVAMGSADEMRKAADALDVVRDTIVSTYRWHSSLDDDALKALMDAETWMDADEAIANGFATEKVEGLRAAASLDVRAIAKLTIPEKYKARVDAHVKPAPADPTPATPLDVMRACREGECLDLAEGFIAAGATLEHVQAKVTETKTARAAATARATEIRSLCTMAKQPELADGYINGQMSPADVRDQLTIITAKLDAVEIDGGLQPSTGDTHAAGWKKAIARVQNRFGTTARH